MLVNQAVNNLGKEVKALWTIPWCEMQGWTLLIKPRLGR